MCFVWSMTKHLVTNNSTANKNNVQLKPLCVAECELQVWTLPGPLVALATHILKVMMSQTIEYATHTTAAIPRRGAALHVRVEGQISYKKRTHDIIRISSTYYSVPSEHPWAL